MKMHALSGGRVRMRKSVYIPDADRSDMIELPISCFLLRHSQGNVLFDTGCHPAVPDDPAARWGVACFAVVAIGAYVVPTALGGNVSRLGQYVAGPLLACALLPRRLFCLHPRKITLR